jgi:molybdopterin-guanine dinucleotide biosynthesis protein A
MPQVVASEAAPEPALPAVGGYVLTGGASLRMGRDKARLPWRGATLVEWIASQVHETVGCVTLVGAPERYAGLGIPVIGETHAGLGPLSGIEAALAHSPFEYSLVVACDMPFLTATALSKLVTAAIGAGADVFATVNASGEWEPLCAIYRARILPEVSQALRDGRLKARDLLAQWNLEGRVGAWTAEDPRMTANANRPEDWKVFESAGD